MLFMSYVPAHGRVRQLIATCAGAWPSRGQVCAGAWPCVPAHCRVCRRVAVSRSNWATDGASALFLHCPAAIQPPAILVAMHAVALCSDVHLVRHSHPRLCLRCAVSRGCREPAPAQLHAQPDEGGEREQHRTACPIGCRSQHCFPFEPLPDRRRLGPTYVATEFSAISVLQKTKLLYKTHADCLHV